MAIRAPDGANKPTLKSNFPKENGEQFQKFIRFGSDTLLFVGHVYNLKNSLKFKLLAFWSKQTPFIDQKCTYEKVPKNLDKIQKISSFFSGYHY